MSWLKYILVFWLLVGRFILNDDFSISGNISALIISFFMLYFSKSWLVIITILVSLSVYYSSVLIAFGVQGYSGILGAISAIITMLFTYKIKINGREFA